MDARQQHLLSSGYAEGHTVDPALLLSLPWPLHPTNAIPKLSVLLRFQCEIPPQAWLWAAASSAGAAILGGSGNSERWSMSGGSRPSLAHLIVLADKVYSNVSSARLLTPYSTSLAHRL